MSFPWKPPIYNVKGRERNWLNTIFTAHDGFCGCENPPQHLILLLCREHKHLELTKQDFETTQKCLTSTEDPTQTTTGETISGGGEEDGHKEEDVDSYDLDALFADDIESAG